MSKDEELLTSLTRPDFQALVAEYPDELGPFYNSNTERFEFRSGDQTVGKTTPDCALTTVLLRKHLQINVDLDPAYLCPRVGNRLAYVTWINRLIDAGDKEVLGLDIGTGASCIYPLLGCALYPNWRFLASDIDQRSIELCKKQIELNQQWLNDEASNPRITVLLKPPDNSFFGKPSSENDSRELDFTMCNPPFYTCVEELEASRKSKQTLPGSELKAQDHELVTQGGELQFVRCMIYESQEHHLRRDSNVSRVQTWYTSMVGKKASLIGVVETLKKLGITNYALHEISTITTGSHANSADVGGTRRWLVGWTFGSRRPKHEVCQLGSMSLKYLNPWATKLSVPVKSGNRERLAEILICLCEEAPNALVQTITGKDHWRLTVPGDVWSRSYRRAKRAKTTNKARKGVTVFLISLKTNQLTVKWEVGDDPRLLESASTMLKRKLEEQHPSNESAAREENK